MIIGIIGIVAGIVLTKYGIAAIISGLGAVALAIGLKKGS